MLQGENHFPRSLPVVRLFPLPSSQSNKISFLSGQERRMSRSPPLSMSFQSSWRRNEGEILSMRNSLSNLFACHSFRPIPFDMSCGSIRWLFNLNRTEDYLYLLECFSFHFIENSSSGCSCHRCTERMRMKCHSSEVPKLPCK